MNDRPGPSSPKRDDELLAKPQEGDTTPQSRIVDSFAEKSAPGAPKKGNGRRLRAANAALIPAFHDLDSLAREEIGELWDNFIAAEKELTMAVEKEEKATIRAAKARGEAEKLAAEAEEANNQAQKANTNKARQEAEEAEQNMIKAKAEAELTDQLAKEASAEVKRAERAAKDAKAEADDAVAVALQTANKSAIEDDDITVIPADEIKSRYSDYVSYSKDKNPLYPIRIWTLSENQLSCFDKYYIICRNLEPVVVMKKIDHILEVNAKRIKDVGDFWFDIPKRDESSMDYNRSLAMPLLRRGHTAKRSFSNGNTKHQACIMVWLLNHLYDAVKRGFYLSVRKIYYDHKLLFRNKKAAAEALNDVFCLLECTPTSLNIIPPQKGTALGKLKLKMSGKIKEVDFSEGTQIPFDIRKIEELEIDKSVEFFLIVEKGTILDHLRRVVFHETHNCVIICGHGQPDERTRGFVRKIEETFDIPIYGITDPDPYGISIMKVYAKGSINLSNNNMNLAVNSIHWIGVCTLDIASLGTPISKKVFRRCASLTLPERKMLQNMRSPKYMLSNLWIQRIIHMLNIDKKACFEDLNVVAKEYVTRVHIPFLIDRVKDNMFQINGHGSTTDNDIVPPSKKVLALPFDDLTEKMKDFVSDALFDDGPYGRLYCADLGNGRYMAVKRMNSVAGPHSNKLFATHVNILSRLKHENLMELHGYSIGGDERLLVYESTAILSLHHALHGAKQLPPDFVLDWKQRVKIAVDIAKGIAYLHEQAGLSIIHGDIRSNNVLLFGNNAKILDFKLPNQSPQHSSPDVGTQKYQPPEFTTSGLTQKGDIFSFGIVLVELLTGKNRAHRNQNFYVWATQRMGDKVATAVDPKLKRAFSVPESEKIAEVAVSCLRFDPELRPTMSTVVSDLSPLVRRS